MKHFRVAVASVADLSTAATPGYWDVEVKMIHPCHEAYFLDNTGVTTPIVAVVSTAPHPSPFLEIVSNFPYNYQGAYDCGDQTISIVA